MALPQTFRENSRARITTFLKIAEDMVSLQTEFNALGGVGYIPAQGDPIWLSYDMTRVEYLAALTALGQFITFYQGGAVSVDATRPAALYKGKV